MRKGGWMRKHCEWGSTVTWESQETLGIWEATNTERLGLEEAPVISAQKSSLKYDAIEEQIYCQQQLWRTEQLCMEVSWVKLH